MRLDEERLEALRSWGERLGQASGEEHAAIGRAILMLVEEIDRLHIELWHARMLPDAAQPVGTIEASEGRFQWSRTRFRRTRKQSLLGRAFNHS
jgi:hypothetical protein